ncbi:hypothetical protein [Nitrolancea hollandica]|uniref:Uncharacterized protein n=1 Tax=Nitrolancea hollandica Lb TaxID=1129897 RepID=I4ENK7_9BACT|nr:hypothetical protein [Nitrolancea hollandica]CCF86270.1 conserved hypothetical protein [Nitrolancea hollandica Lb]
MGLSTVRLNLSYVLHEPSTSRQVESAARQVIANERKARAAVDRLSRLQDAELLRRVVSPVPLDSIDLPISESFVTLQIGAWQLIPRLLAALRATRQLDRPFPVHVQFLDGLTGSQTVATPFFRGPAQLRLPSTNSSGRLPGHFVSLILRPGGSRLQLILDPLMIDTGQDPRAGVLKAAGPLAEAVIRSHAGQWFCSRNLWPRPAEQELPEFRHT